MRLVVRVRGIKEQRSCDLKVKRVDIFGGEGSFTLQRALLSLHWVTLELELRLRTRIKFCVKLGFLLLDIFFEFHFCSSIFRKKQKFLFLHFLSILQMAAERDDWSQELMLGKDRELFVFDNLSDHELKIKVLFISLSKKFWMNKFQIITELLPFNFFEVKKVSTSEI